MADRFLRRQEDINLVLQACNNDPACPFFNLESVENLIAFEAATSAAKKFYRISLSEDYPDHCVVSKGVNPTGQFESDISSDRLPYLLDKIAKELGSNWTCPIAGNLGNQTNPAMERLNSNTSQYTDCNSDEYSEDEDENDYYNDVQMEDGEEGGIQFHALLEQDMNSIKAVYGEGSLTYRVFSTIDDIDVELNIPMQFLDTEIAQAWRVKAEEPLVIRLHMSVSRYLDGPEPKVEVFQPSQKERFGLGSQMRKIMEDFLSANWKKISNETVSRQFEPPVAGPPAPKKKYVSSKSGLSGVLSWFHKNKDVETGSADSVGTSSAYQDSSIINDHSIAKLMEMGFATDLSQNALLITKGNVDEALNLLLTSPESCTDLDKALPPKPPIPPRPSRQNSRGAKGKKAAPRQSNWPHPGGGDVGGVRLDSLMNLVSPSTLHGHGAKTVPGLDKGFLVQAMKYALQRLPTLNEFCVVCDEPHVFQNGAMLKPAVCARELCVFAFQTLGVMSDAAEDIATGAEVVNLLICMALSACKSNRKATIFDPFPTIVDPSNPCELALSNKNKDFARAEKALDSLMSMKKMTEMVGSDLKKHLDQNDILAYPLLQWIITSNRSHIVKLPVERQIASMNTPHQFLLMSSPPAKEAIFCEAKKKYGSIFAFHGSHIENWHCIMREGLINASGTKYQMHGAAYGKGIYLSPHASVSFGYSGMGYGSHRAMSVSPDNRAKTAPSPKGRFLHSKNLTCIALCEVITSKELKKNSNIWVMPEPDHVCTRFFFVYEDGQVGDSGIDTTVDKYKQEVNRAVNYKYGLH